MKETYIPRKWNTWKVIESIGNGSVSEVFHVKDRITGKDAALKVITICKETIDDTGFIDDIGIPDSIKYKISLEKKYYQNRIDQTQKEIFLLNSLKGHPNIVEIYDHEIETRENKTTIFILMEYLQDLLAWFDTIEMNDDVITDLGVQLCEALSYCESRNIFHKDIKPENILVTRDGTFKLTDFSAADNFSQAEDSDIIPQGTKLYMAPEVLMGHSYTKESEVYALGLVLYQLANKKCLPFMDKRKNCFLDQDFQYAIEQRCIDPDIDLPSEVSDKIGNILLKACSYNEEDRYSSVDDFKNALQGKCVKRNGSSKSKMSFRRIPVAIAIVSLMICGSIFIRKSILNMPDNSLALTAEAASEACTEAITADEKVTTESNESHNATEEAYTADTEISPELLTADEVATNADTMIVSGDHAFKMKDMYQVGDSIYDNFMKITYTGSGVYKSSNKSATDSGETKYIYFDFELENLSTDMVRFFSKKLFSCYADGELDSKVSTNEASRVFLTPKRVSSFRLIYKVNTDCKKIKLEYDPWDDSLDKLCFLYENKQMSDFHYKKGFRKKTSETYALNETISTPEMNITVTGTEVLNPRKNTKIREGCHLLKVYFEIANENNEEPTVIYHDDFNLFADGQHCFEKVYFSDFSKELISKGSVLKTSVTYQVPDDANVLELDYMENWKLFCTVSIDNP